MAVSATTWGNPTATKRVLLVHGMTRSSQFWHPVAQDLASRGYFVVAPDLLGHGLARRGTVYTIAALAEELGPFLTAPKDRPDDHPYDVIIGHSLGALLITSLFPLFTSARPVRVVLVDPPLEVRPMAVPAYRRTLLNWVMSPQTPEAFLEENPTWTKEDAVIASLSARLCSADTIRRIADQNLPWSFSHYLLTVPENVRVRVLAADPSKRACVSEQEVKVKAYPHVTVETVWGTSHLIPLERPDVVVATALGDEQEFQTPVSREWEASVNAASASPGKPSVDESRYHYGGAGRGAMGPRWFGSRL